MQILTTLRKNNKNFSIVNKTLKIIENGLAELLEPADLIANAKKEYEELFKEPAPIDHIIEEKLI